MVSLTEPIFAKAVHAWLEGHVYALLHGLQIAPAEPGLLKPDEAVGGSRKFARYLPFWA